jgi:hypothetical protein
MSGQTMNYRKYYDYLKTMPEPVMPSQLPEIKINLKTAAQVAKKHNVCYAKLSDREKEKFLEEVKLTES